MNRIAGKKVKSFTLIEVVVAMTILAAGILGIMGAISLCIQTNSRAFRLEKAVDLARKELNLSSLCKSNLENQTGSEGIFTWSVSFQKKEYDLVVASAVINWSEKGKAQTFTLSRILLPQESN